MPKTIKTLDQMMKDASVSPTMLIKELGITYPTLQNYRRRITKPDISQTKLMSGILGVTLDELATFFDDASNKEATECDRR